MLKRVIITPIDTYISDLVCRESDINIELFSFLPSLYSNTLTKVFTPKVKIKTNKLSKVTSGVLGVKNL
ncbi:hypothetical protein SDC9_128934 [bioreactor metagenome]|uniref:Uncharacterized protein n=1 Tax=bioreactor metagenome TaxID=1076179 RepID=A0A645CY94_9ZZZZ